MNSDNPQSPLDEATARRLARLRAMPIDTSRLERMIESQIARPASSPARHWRLRTWRAVAASLFVFILAGVVMWSLSGGSVQASPDVMARFHDDLVSGKVAAIQVNNIADANTALATELRKIGEIPDVPTEHAMLCCMRTIDNKRVACVLLRSEGNVPVTMAVAQASDLRMAHGEKQVVGGVTYHIQRSGNLNMVMCERSGRWICLIGALSTDKLISIAGAMEL